MKLGFAKTDITPRIGVELCGFGPFLNRHSTGIRDRLWARAMAVSIGHQQAVVVTCDFIGVTRAITHRVRELLGDSRSLAPENVMVCCSHTHSGPAPGCYIGWGEADPPYLAVLPHRIVQAAASALDNLQPARLQHAEVACEGIAINREYDQFWAPYEEAMRPDWRPAKAEVTDTTCHVFNARSKSGDLLGFITYFGCHPVVCCSESTVIHGDYPGIALNNIERDFPGAVGLFLQGAQGDINTAIGGRNQQESLLALDEIAGRFARSVRQGIAGAQDIEVRDFQTCLREVIFTRKSWCADKIKHRLEDAERNVMKAGPEGLPTDTDKETRINMVYAIALRRLFARLERGEAMEPATEVHGLRLGPIEILGCPFETFRAIKNDIVNEARAEIPLVTSFTNDSVGYAPDTTCAERGGYAADMVPLICGELPYADIHRELVEALLKIDRNLGERPFPGGSNQK